MKITLDDRADYCYVAKSGAIVSLYKSTKMSIVQDQSIDVDNFYNTECTPCSLRKENQCPGVYELEEMSSCRILYSTNIETRSLSITIPKHVFIKSPSNPNNYYIYIVKEDELYGLNIGNVYSDGEICWGTNIDYLRKRRDIKYAYNYFWNSRFNCDLTSRSILENSKFVQKEEYLVNTGRKVENAKSKLEPLITPARSDYRPAIYCTTKKKFVYKQRKNEEPMVTKKGDRDRLFYLVKGRPYSCTYRRRLYEPNHFRQ